MQWETREAWGPWFVPGERHEAGKVRMYANGVVFVTVEGAGHEVPAFKGKEALFLFAQYLQGGFKAEE
jgi:hypothetical protein